MRSGRLFVHHPLPSVFFVEGGAGNGVFSAATGHLVRAIHAHDLGGPDLAPELSSDRKTVFFFLPAVGCGSQIVSRSVTAVSGRGGP